MSCNIGIAQATIFIITNNNGKNMKKNIYIYLSLNHSAIHQKHIIYQLYFNKKFKEHIPKQNKQKERYLGLLSCLLGIYNILHYTLR